MLWRSETDLELLEDMDMNVISYGTPWDLCGKHPGDIGDVCLDYCNETAIDQCICRCQQFMHCQSWPSKATMMLLLIKLYKKKTSIKNRYNQIMLLNVALASFYFVNFNIIDILN